MKTVVLVTAIGTVAASHIVSEIKKTNEYYIIGARHQSCKTRLPHQRR